MSPRQARPKPLTWKDLGMPAPKIVRQIETPHGTYVEFELGGVSVPAEEPHGVLRSEGHR